MTFCGNPLLRSLLGVKRTSLFAAQMSVGGSRSIEAIAPAETQVLNVSALRYPQQRGV